MAAAEQQAATAAILKAISQSHAGAGPVFRAIARHAVRLCDGVLCNVLRYDGEMLHVEAHHGFGRKALKNLRSRYPAKPEPHLLSGRVIRRRAPVHILDAQSDPRYDHAHAKAGGWRRMIGVPILGNDTVLGVLVVAWKDIGRTPKDQVELLETFASQAAIAIENARLFNETKESLERQTATAEILKVIAASPSDVQPVFDAIARSAVRLCEGVWGALFTYDGKMMGLGAQVQPNPEVREMFRRAFPQPITPTTPSAIAILERRVVNVPDMLKAPFAADVKARARAGGYRSVLTVPMMLGKTPIGAIAVTRPEAAPFADSHVALLKTFAAQAVIAIENARLFNETKEALERQTATAEILKVISGSPGDLRPVFDAIIRNAIQLVGGFSAVVTRSDGGKLHLEAFISMDPARDESVRAHFPMPVESGTAVGEAIIRGKLRYVPDALDESRQSPGGRALAVARGYRSLVHVPMKRHGEVVGALHVTHRKPGAFMRHHLDLLQTFADQAVIAIENARLFNETKEALEQQTASSDVLGVISSSPTDLRPVFDSILASATRLCDAHLGVLNLYDGVLYRTVAQRGGTPKFAKWVIERGAFKPVHAMARMIAERKPMQIPDLKASPVFREGNVHAVNFVELGGARTYLTVPLVKDDKVLGGIAIYRPEVRPFTEKQVELVKTFADQAVIAIENVRLFNETKESLERQTATAEILKVISSSPTNTQPVFDAIVQSGARLFEPCSAVIVMREGDLLQLKASAGAFLSLANKPAVKAAYPLKFDPDQNLSSRAIADRRVLEIEDMQGPNFSEVSSRIAREAGFRSVVLMPLVRDGEGIGTLSLTHPEPGYRLNEKQLALLQTFADQAVIAIENVRLFNETKESLEQQTASSEVLEVISKSPSDLGPVFDAILGGATRLCDAHLAFLNLYDGESYRTVAQRGANPEFLRWVAERGAFKPGPVTSLARVAEEREPVQVLDMKESPAFRAGDVNVVKFAELAGARTYLVVPLLKDDQILGVFAIYRPEVRPFTEKQVELVKTFARQAVIAMENVRLFNETKESLERQTATADILRVIASTPTDTHPVFEAIVEATQRLIAGRRAGILVRQGDNFVATAFTFAGFEKIPEEVRVVPLDREKNFPSRAILDGEVVHIPDWESDDVPEFEKQVARYYGVKSGVMIPLMRKGEGIGALAVARETAGPYHEKEIALLCSFADQAVIAIENTRLFNETKESLEQQTAISEILRAISDSPTDVRPVLEAVAQRAARICDASDARIFLIEGERVRNVAGVGDVPITVKLGDTIPLERGLTVGRAILDRVSVHIEDIRTVSREEMPLAREIADRSGYRTVLVVPLLREARALGAIALRRMEVRPFSDKQIALLKTFADQAAIAIENVRLFNETKEALEQQTATGEILKVISSSPTDVQPVFDTIIRNAVRLGNAAIGFLINYDGVAMELGSQYNADPQAESIYRPAFPRPAARDTMTGRSIVERVVINVPDIASSDFGEGTKERARRAGYRSALIVPMIRGGVPIGTLNIQRREAGAFPDSYVALLQTFADQAVIAIENARLFNETKEALERQTATAEILRVIASSPSDVQPVFDAIAASARRLLDGGAALVAQRVGDQLELVAYTSTGEAEDAALRKLFPTPITGQGHLGKAILSAAPVGISDIQNDESYSEAFRAIQRVRGLRSVVSVPMLREGEAIGVISVNRPVPGKFSEHQTNLLKTFADQAVIAIENVRLFNETKEALEQQTATAEILKIISSSPTDVQPVFDGIVSSAIALFAPCNSGIWMLEGGQVHLRAVRRQASDYAHMEGVRRLFPRPVEDSFAIGKSIVERRIVEVPDTERAGFAAGALELSRTMVTRSCIFFPLMRKGEAIGCIGLSSPEAGLKLTDKQMALMRTFADQAVIAIENVRLFNETKESLERQTATAEILKVISGSPTDEKPVFDAIVASAARLFGRIARIRLVEDGRLILRARSDRSMTDGVADEPLALDRDSAGGCVALDRVALQIPDTRAPEAPALALKWGEKGGYRAIALAPLIRESTLLGVIAVTSPEPGGLTDKQMALLQTFADQAVIAIENVRLFNETKEGLEQQTAISEVLRVISSSPADVKPVLDAVAIRAARICDALDSRIFLVEGDSFRYVAGFGDVGILTPSIPLDRDTPSGRAIIDRAPQHVEDIQALPEDEFPRARAIALKSGWRTILIVPLLREGRALGTISLRRKEVRPFSEKQVALLQTFADQAAIAIENVRLFNETREALEQQTATAEVLNVISGSITDARPVFDAISRSVLRLYGARSVSLVVRFGERIDRVGYALADKSADDGSQALWPIPLDDKSLSGRAILSGELVHIKDADAEPGLSEHSRAIRQQTGLRSALVAPMFSMGAAIGALAVGRRAAGGFSEREVEMIRTFADQAVIAMENVRLFREIQEKSAQLEVASQHKSQFLASMSHELRTPLNALLGFNEMLLGDVYGDVPGDMRPPLAQMQASGKHLLGLINNVLDLAKIEAGRMELALAEYSVHDTVESVRSTLQPLAADKGLDFRAAVPPEIPLAYGDPGRITQCLMNLAGNSLKFTKAGTVEISVAMDNGLLRYRVADTGVGIPPDKIDGLFTEFKQTDATIASEYGGTGLGLSISKKFVEMHGGRIWAESEPGRGSVFTFEVPLRARAA